MSTIYLAKKRIGKIAEDPSEDILGEGSRSLGFSSPCLILSLFEISMSSLSLPSNLVVAQMVKNLPVIHETQVHSLGQEDSPGGGNGNPLQYSCLENSMDRGAWRATVHGVPKSQTQLSN